MAYERIIGKKHHLVQFHMPRTGGMWRSAVLHQCPAPLKFPKHTNGEELQYRTHITLSAYKQEAMKADLTCTFVRHPYTWWKSYFGRAREVDWVEHTLAVFRAATFDQFIRNMLHFVPRKKGWYSTFYCAERFVGPPGEEVDMILKYECMKEGLLCALKLAGIEMDNKHVWDALPMNQTLAKCVPKDLDGWLRGELEKAEDYAMTRYLYNKPSGATTIQVRKDLVEPCNAILADISKWALKERGVDSNVIAVAKHAS